MYTLFYSALSKDQHVRNAMVLGSPIDSHASGVLGLLGLLGLLGADYPVGRPGVCSTTSAFLDRMVAYPGGVVQDTVVRIWIDNQLSRGTVQIGDEPVQLNNFNVNLFVLAGSEDTMVTPGSGNGGSGLHCYP